MKKHLIVIGIVFVLLMVGLSGCTDNLFSSDKNRFVGTWTWLGITIYTFRSDGTYSGTATTGTYEIKDGKLICKADNYDYAASYYYSFSDNDNVLMLEGIGAESLTLNRKI